MRRQDFYALFRRERNRFARHFPWMREALLTVSALSYTPGSPRTFRDLAWCYPRTAHVVFAHRALRLPRRNLVALIRHELSHVVFPGSSERDTDLLAGRVGGQRIRYDARSVQTVGRGGPRPAWLHK